MITPRLVRLVSVLVCAGGVAGMIATSIADNTDGALAFGLLSVAGAGALLLIGAVAPSGSGVDEVVADQLEQEIRELVEAGVEERRLRRVVSLARRLSPPSPP